MSLGPLMIDLKGTSLDADERQWLQSPVVGGVILFTRNYADPQQLQQLVAEIHGVRQPPLLVAVDHEGGRVQRFREAFFRLPPLRALGRLYDENPAAALKVATSFGWLMAAELRAVDVDLSFTPVVDLDLGLADVIGDRALHADSEVVASLALRFAAGAKQAGMSVTAKHFPTHAGARSDSHTELAVDRREYAELFDDLRPYRRLIDSGLQAVMVAHVSFPQIDPLPASLSSWWINEQLRGELGFGGAVITDDVSMVGASVAGSVAERVRLALDAGCDLVLLCNAPEQVPAVLESLGGYVNPPGQLRLARLHGRGGGGWEALHASREWQAACAALEPLCARPGLELKG
ncbi:MAG TPA: beta-N-acetylhexosaminidase [Gammaproteobacteria bacterium]|nr:beta-N-acetylhexosaminidase [Gammaproteobacteria bacterium]